MKGKAAFLVHPCTPEQNRIVADLHGLGPLPTFAGRPGYPEVFPTNLPPKVDGIWRDANGDIVLEIVIVPMSAVQFLKGRNGAIEAVKRAIEFSIEHDATVVGLGALTSPVTDGGRKLLSSTGWHGLGDTLLTTGNPYTSFTMLEAIKRLSNELGKAITDPDFTVAVIGGTGSVGWGGCELLIQEGMRPRNIIAVGRSVAKIDELKNSGIRAGTMEQRLGEIGEATIVVFTTTGFPSLSANVLLGNCAVVLDMTMPSFVASRPDFGETLRQNGVIIEHGGIVEIPKSHSYEGVNLGIPLEHAWACEVDTALRALEGEKGRPVVGRVDPVEARRMAEKARHYGFKLVQ